MRQRLKPEAHVPTRAQVEALKAQNVRSASGYYASGWEDAIDAVLRLYAGQPQEAQKPLTRSTARCAGR